MESKAPCVSLHRSKVLPDHPPNPSPAPSNPLASSCPLRVSAQSLNAVFKVLIILEHSPCSALPTTANPYCLYNNAATPSPSPHRTFSEPTLRLLQRQHPLSLLRGCHSRLSASPCSPAASAPSAIFLCTIRATSNSALPKKASPTTRP